MDLYTMSDVSPQRVCIDAIFGILSRSLPQLIQRELAKRNIQTGWLEFFLGKIPPERQPSYPPAPCDPLWQLRVLDYAYYNRLEDAKSLISIRNRFAHWTQMDDDAKEALTAARHLYHEIGAFGRARTVLRCRMILPTVSEVAADIELSLPPQHQVSEGQLRASGSLLEAAKELRHTPSSRGLAIEFRHSEASNFADLFSALTQPLQQLGYLTLRVSCPEPGAGHVNIIDSFASGLGHAITANEETLGEVSVNALQARLPASPGSIAKLVYAIEEAALIHPLALLISDVGFLDQASWSRLQKVLDSVLEDAPETLVVWARPRTDDLETELPHRTLDAALDGEDVRDLIRGMLKDWDTQHANRNQIASAELSVLIPQIQAVIDEYAESIIGPQPRIQLFRWLTIVDFVTGPEMISDTFSCTEDQAESLYISLKNCPFTTALSDEEWPAIRLHDLISSSLPDTLPGDDQASYAELHMIAADYYQTKIDLNDPVDAYDDWAAAWNALESAEYHHDCDRWLYHLGSGIIRIPRDVINSMIRLFFESFWWWDCNLPIDSGDGFTWPLLDGYAALREKMGESDWLDCLTTFRKSYVCGWDSRQPGQNRERWKDARQSLHRLLKILNLEPDDSPPVDRSLRRIQTLTFCFLADATWCGGSGLRDAEYQEAEYWYVKAAEAATSDEWIKAWIDFYRAEMWLHFHPEKTQGILKELLPTLVDAFDERELVVHLIRLIGDLAWNFSNYESALKVYTHAVLHAYAYHVRQEREHMAPSQYTLGLYQHTLAKANNRFHEVEERENSEIVQRAVAHRDTLFAPWWEKWGTLDDDDIVAAESEPSVGQCGFPAPPAPGDLNRTDSSYFEEVEWTITNIGTELGRQLQCQMDKLIEELLELAEIPDSSR